MDCADCGQKIRVFSPCVHGGLWRCWNCHPEAREYLKLPIEAPFLGGRKRDPNTYRAHRYVLKFEVKRKKR